MDQNSGSPAGQGGLAFTLVADEQDVLHSSQDLRAALEKGTDELKLGEGDFWCSRSLGAR